MKRNAELNVTQRMEAEFIRFQEEKVNFQLKIRKGETYNINAKENWLRKLI